MGEFKTIISANIKIATARRLKSARLPGSRSAMIDAAIIRYLDELDSFKPGDMPTRQLLAILVNRQDIPVHLQTLILQELNA